MQLLEITITGIGPIALTIGIAIAIGFVFGALVYRNNAAKANAALTAAQEELAKVKATAGAVGAAVKKV
jgi:hypothetical protein